MDTTLRFIDDSDVCSLTFLAAGLSYVGLLLARRHPEIPARSFPWAGGIFLVYALQGILRTPFLDAASVAAILIRGGLGALLVFGSLCLLWSVLRPFTDTWRQLQDTRRAERERREWERAAPERARRALEAEAQRRRDETQQLRLAALSRDEQSRREAARLKCRLFYDRHISRLQSRFQRELLDEYFLAYLADSHPADDVEDRAALLMEMLEGHLKDQPGTGSEFESLAAISAHFQQQREAMLALPYDPETMESLLVALNQQESAAIESFFRRGR